MSAKQRTKNRIRQRLVEKLNDLTAQEDVLHSVVKTYVDQARLGAEAVLAVEDTEEFLARYGGLEQDLDRAFSTCEILTATAEDMIGIVDGGKPADTEEAAACKTQVVNIPEARTKPQSDVRKESGSTEQRPKEDTAALADTYDSSQLEQQTLSSKQTSTEVEKSSLRSNKVTVPSCEKSELKSPKVTVPQCVKKTLKYYDSGFEASSLISEVSDQDKFVKDLQAGSLEATSSANKKQKSPKKKKVKKEKGSKDDTKSMKTIDVVNEQINDTENKINQKSNSVKVKTVKTNNASADIEQVNTGNPCTTTSREPKAKGNVAEGVDKTHTSITEDFPGSGAAQIDWDPDSSAMCQGFVQPLLNQEVTPVVVSEIISPWCFFVQPNSNQLKELMAEIRVYMTTVGMMECHLEAPTVGAVCLARFSTDNAFYRACVTRVYMSGDSLASHVDVLYLDYGNKEKVKVTELRSLPQTFRLLPPQAACCALAEVMPSNKYCVWREEDIFNFKQFVCNQQLSCIRACSSSLLSIPHLVKLVGNYPMPSTMAGMKVQYVLQPVGIGQFLINRGSAKHMDITEQVRHLIKTEEGKEEASILNGTFTDTGGPRIRELNDSFVIPAAHDTHLGEKSACDGDTTNHLDKSDKQDTVKLDNKPAVTGGSKSVSEKGDSTSVTGDSKYTSAKEDSKIVSESGDSKSVSETGGSKSVSETGGSKSEVLSETETARKTGSEYVLDSYADSSASKETDHRDKQHGQGTRPKILRTEAERNELKGTAATRGKAVSAVSKDRLPNEGSRLEKISSTDSLDTETSSSITDKDQSKKQTAKNPGVDHTDKFTFQKPGVDHTDKSTFQMLNFTSDLSTNPHGKEVMLAHVKSPGHFYVHLVSKEVGQSLDDLMKHLNQRFEKMNRRKLTNLSRTFVPEVNKLCCAHYTQDNNFYRAMIKDVRKGGSKTDSDTEKEKVLVLYVDFGDEEWVSRHRVYPLPEELSTVPPLATCCSLAFIKPLTVAGDSTSTWLESATEMFTSLAGFEKTLHMHIVQGSLSGDKNSKTDGGDCVLGALLVDNTGTEEVCINLELIRNGQAQLDTSQGRDKQGGVDQFDAAEVWNPMEEDYMSKRNSYKIDVDDAGVATTGYKANDGARVCKFYAQGRRCWRGDLCPYRHVQTDSGVSLDQEEVYALGGSQERLLPSVHSWVALEVTTILTPGRFYAILPLGRKSLDIHTSESEEPEDILGSSSCNETLDDLLTALNAEYNKRPSFQGTSILKAAGEIVAARFSQDHQWYRARVLQVTEDKVKVFYVDFGNTEWLSEDEVGEIKPEFLHLPFQALECFLYRVEPAGQHDTWSPEAQSYFRELVDGKTLVGHVRASSWNSCLTVELFDTTTDKDINIGDMMVEGGHAVKSTLPTESSCNVSEPGSSRRSSVSTASAILVPG